jgi:hypothetical protein
MMDEERGLLREAAAAFGRGNAITGKNYRAQRKLHGEPDERMAMARNELALAVDYEERAKLRSVGNG